VVLESFLTILGTSFWSGVLATAGAGVAGLARVREAPRPGCGHAEVPRRDDGRAAGGCGCPSPGSSRST